MEERKTKLRHDKTMFLLETGKCMDSQIQEIQLLNLFGQRMFLHDSQQYLFINDGHDFSS